MIHLIGMVIYIAPNLVKIGLFHISVLVLGRLKFNSTIILDYCIFLLKVFHREYCL